MPLECSPKEPAGQQQQSKLSNHQRQRESFSGDASILGYTKQQRLSTVVSQQQQIDGRNAADNTPNQQPLHHPILRVASAHGSRDCVNLMPLPTKMSSGAKALASASRIMSPSVVYHPNSTAVSNYVQSSNTAADSSNAHVNMKFIDVSKTAREFHEIVSLRIFCLLLARMGRIFKLTY